MSVMPMAESSATAFSDSRWYVERTLNTLRLTGLCSSIAPVDGPRSGTRSSSSTGMMSSLCGVPRVRKSATAPFSTINVRAFAAASFGSNLSSSETSTIFCPFTPPRAFTASK